MRVLHPLPVGTRGKATAPEIVCAYDCSDFHPGCPVTLYTPPGHSHGLLWCPKHRVAIDLEACATRCTLEEAKETA